MNFLEGSLSNGSVQLGEHRVTLPPRIVQTLSGRSGPVVVGIRPEDFVTGDGAAPESETLPAQIEITEQLGPEMLVHFDVPGVALANVEVEEVASAAPVRGGRLVSRAPATFKGARGDRIRVALVTEHLQLFDPGSGEALL